MKKILLLIFAMAAIMADAQTPSVVGNSIQYKKVATYEGKTKDDIFIKTLLTLSKIEGTTYMSSNGLDVQDKDAGVISYKGRIYLGFYKQNIMAGWDVFLNYNMIVRCKDGKAKYEFITPSVHFIWSANDTSPRDFPVTGIYPAYNIDTYYKIEKSSKQFGPHIPEYIVSFVDNIIKLTSEPEEDF